MSNIGIAAMVWGVVYASSVYGVANVIKYYAFPWLEVSHWCKHLKFLNMNRVLICALYIVIMITYLHHTDPTLPHYRGKEWNFQRGAAATVDRDFLGWQGRFFLHDVAHYHVIHHVGVSSARSLSVFSMIHLLILFYFDSSSPRCLSVRKVYTFSHFRADPDELCYP